MTPSTVHSCELADAMLPSRATGRRTVLILGANGRLGHAAAEAFAQAGWRVLAQTRRALQPGLPASVETLSVAIDDPVALRRAAAGAAVVVHALNPVYTRWAQDLLPMARASMDLAQDLDALWVLPGNVYNYGVPMPTLLKVDTPMTAVTRKGRLRCALEAEMATRAVPAGGRTPLRSLVLRAGDFYGGRQPGSWLDRVIAASLQAKGQVVYPGPLDVVHAWAYLPDLAIALEAAVATLVAEPSPGMTVLHFEGHSLTGQQWVEALCTAAESLGWRAPPRGWVVRRFPWWPVMRALAWAVPMWRELVEMRYLWEQPHRLDGDRLAALVDLRSALPVHQAMQRSLSQMLAWR